MPLPVSSLWRSLDPQACVPLRAVLVPTKKGGNHIMADGPSLSDKLELAGAAVGSVVASLGTLWRWFRGRERRIHARLSDVEARIVTNDRRLVTLEVQRIADTERMQQIAETVLKVDEKQDEQTKLLVEIIRGQGRHS